jgi:phosphatidylglycerophosphatase A
MSLSDRPRGDVSDVTPRPLPPRPDAAAAPPTRSTRAGGRAHAAPAHRGPARRPGVRLRAHPAHWIALGFGSGLSPVAPGTVGTLWAWLAWAVLGLWLTPAQLGWLLAVSLPLAWWACAVSADHLNVADPSAGGRRGRRLLARPVAGAAGQLLGQLAAFALFRFFDAVKPGRWAGPTACCTARAAGAAASASCWTTWWPPAAPCW